MREDDDLVLARLVLARRERAPDQRPRAEEAETIGRHPQAIEALRLAVSREIHVGVVKRREAVERDALLFPVEKHARRNRVPFAWAGRFPHLHELSRLVVMERLQQHTIDGAEDRCVRSNPERERENGDAGEDRVLPQLAEGEANVIHKTVAAGVRRLWTMGKSEGQNPKESRSLKSEQSAYRSLFLGFGFRISFVIW